MVCGVACKDNDKVDIAVLVYQVVRGVAGCGDRFGIGVCLWWLV